MAHNTKNTFMRKSLHPNAKCLLAYDKARTQSPSYQSCPTGLISPTDEISGLWPESPAYTIQLQIEDNR